MSTTHRPAYRSPQRDAGPWLGRAWGAVVSVPLFFLLAFAVGEALYAVMGYKPENADAPIWVVVVADVATLTVAVLPCAAAMVLGRRAQNEGDRRGRLPLVLGAIAGVALVILTVVSEVGDFVRR